LMRWPSNRKRTESALSALREQNASKICVRWRGRRGGMGGEDERQRKRGFWRYFFLTKGVQGEAFFFLGCCVAERSKSRAHLLELGGLPDLEVHLRVVLW
jgi:hypothetical protein